MSEGERSGGGGRASARGHGAWQHGVMRHGGGELEHGSDGGNSPSSARAAAARRVVWS